MVPLGQVLASTGMDLDQSAIETLEKAEAGDADAQCEFGVILLERQKDDVAFNWLNEAANQRQSEAMHLLATFYLNGRGSIQEDRSLWLKWLEKAARQGHAIAKAQWDAIKP